MITSIAQKATAYILSDTPPGIQAPAIVNVLGYQYQSKCPYLSVIAGRHICNTGIPTPLFRFALTIDAQVALTTVFFPLYHDYMPLCPEMRAGCVAFELDLSNAD